jgi:hypothetical protein
LDFLSSDVVEQIFESVERLNLPISWAKCLIEKKGDITKNQLNQTYNFVEKAGLDWLNLRLFEEVVESLGLNGLEMNISEAVILLKYAKIKEIKARDISKLMKKV